MANNVSFIIQLKDQFGRTATRVRKQFQGIKLEADKAGRAVAGSAKRIKSSFADMRGGMAKAGAVMTAAVSVPLGLLSKQMVNAASDAEETANKFNEVFKGIGPTATAAVDELTSGFFLAKSSAQDLLSNTGDLLVGLGLNREQALALSADVVKLSADVASFKNVQGGTARAADALTKALLGEREMLKETFKTAVREEDVKKRAALLRIKDRKLTEQQAKALATLAIVTERNKDAIGDLARTSESFANVARANDEAMKTLSESMGRLLLPLATKLVKGLTKLVQWVDSLSPGMKKLVLVLGGLVAIGGPLLLVVAGLATAFTVISLPVLAVTAAVLAFVAAGVLVAARWDEIMGGLTALWGGFKETIQGIIDSISDSWALLWEGRFLDALKSSLNVAIKWINMLLTPLDFVMTQIGGLEAGSLKIAEFRGTAPTTPTKAAGGTLSGNITVSATPGAVVESTSLATRGSGLDIGMNMAGP